MGGILNGQVPWLRIERRSFLQWCVALSACGLGKISAATASGAGALVGGLVVVDDGLAESAVFAESCAGLTVHKVDRFLNNLPSELILTEHEYVFGLTRDPLALIVEQTFPVGGATLVHRAFHKMERGQVRHFTDDSFAGESLVRKRGLYSGEDVPRASGWASGLACHLLSARTLSAVPSVFHQDRNFRVEPGAVLASSWVWRVGKGAML